MSTMNEQEKLIKKYNKIYVIELFVIAAVVLVLATLKITGVIGTNPDFRHVFNIITLVVGIYFVVDFIWLLSSKKRQQRNSWFDKISLIPFAISMIVVDIICISRWNETIEWYSLFISIAFYYIALIYIAQGLYHLKKPAPSIVYAARDEMRAKEEEAKKQAEQPQEENKENK